jgi:16S rRNA (adenine1518-N6/adenine1519-N6)-dimethyltransferase
MTPQPLGQHFLADEDWRERIALAIFGLNAYNDTPANSAGARGVWIEIGAGHGEMTALLARQAARVIAIELDPGLVGTLRATASDFPNVTVVAGDILALDLAALADRTSTGDAVASPLSAATDSTPSHRFRVYGNLPYYITSPIVHRLFEHAERLESAFILVQLEVAERIAAKPGSRDYGYFSVFTQFYAQPQILLRIPPGAFSPPPRVSSALVALRTPGERATLGITDENAFLKFLKGCFAQKRKTLRNNLRTFLPPATNIQTVLSESGLSIDARAEELTLAQFAQLFAVSYRGKSR